MPEPITPQNFIKHKLNEAGFCDEALPGAQLPEAQSSSEDLPQANNEEFAEGALKTAYGDRYERSRVARRACINAHGTACAICGFDFAKVYGPEFAGIIQVHHIVPLHEIAKSHKVDPAHDLIPVCPNCHVALHAKPGGVYTPAELREIMRGVNASTQPTQRQ